MMKYKLHSLLALLLTLGLLTGPVAAMSFPDVATGAWYSEAVEYVSELSVMIGDEQGNFNPNKPVTRAEMAVIICKILEQTKSEEEYLPIYLEAENFSDVPASHWANIYINKITALEIASGYGDGRFGPSDYLTYEQAVTMVVQAVGAGTEALERGGYPDGFLAVANEMGLLSGVRAAKGEALSRANVAVLLLNYLNDSVGTNHPTDEDHIDSSKENGNDLVPGDHRGDEVESNPEQEDQTGDSLQLGEIQQGNQGEDSPGQVEIGGGT